MTRPGCQATRSNDEMRCAKCHLTWDVSDPEPPACKTSALTPRPRPIPYRSMGPNVTLGLSRRKYLKR